MRYASSVRIIGHIDLDAFFASVEEREKPYLKGAPIIVGSDPQGGRGRGVVSTASYAARRYGVRSAMPISKAWKLCESARCAGYPACVFVTPGMHSYSKASQEVFALVRKHVRVLEQVSVDEAYLDLSFTGSYTQARRLAEVLRKDIRDTCGLTASIGIGPNKLIAKIAAGTQKPNGLTIVTTRAAERFLDPLPLQEIPGIGPKTAARLKQKGFKTVHDAKALAWQDARRMFGKWGFSLYERLRAIDDRAVVAEHEAPLSIGRHHTFETDTRNLQDIQEVLMDQARRIMRTFAREGFTSFKTVVLTVRFSDFTTVSRSLTLSEPRGTLRELELKAIKLILSFLESRENPRNKALRLVGLRIEKLE